MTFDILDPSSSPAAATVLAPRARDSLRGGRVGVIWNGRPNGDLAMRQILETLSETHAIEIAAFRKKPLIGNVAPEEIFQDMTSQPVDFVLAGVGD